jgi:hypothetical protein
MKKIKEQQEEEKQPGEERRFIKKTPDKFKSNKLIPLSEIRQRYEKKYNEINRSGFEQETAGKEKNVRETKRDDSSTQTPEGISTIKGKDNRIPQEKSVRNLGEEKKNLRQDKDIGGEKSRFSDDLTVQKNLINGRDNLSKDMERLKALENKEGISEEKKREIREKRKEIENILKDRPEPEEERAGKGNKKNSPEEIRKPLEPGQYGNTISMTKPGINKSKIPKLISLEKLRGNYNRKYNGFKTQELTENQYTEYVRKDNKDPLSKNRELENNRIYQVSDINKESVELAGQKETIKERDTEKIISEKDKEIVFTLQDKTQLRERKIDGEDKSAPAGVKDKNFPAKLQEKYTPSEGKIDSDEKRKTIQEKFKNILSDLRGIEDKHPVPERKINSDEKRETFQEQSRNISSETGKTKDKNPVQERKIDSGEKRKTIQEKFKNILSDLRGTEDKNSVSEREMASEDKSDVSRERDDKKPVSEREIASEDASDMSRDKDDTKSVSEREMASEDKSDVSRERDKNFMAESLKTQENQPSTESISQEKLTAEQKEHIENYNDSLKDTINTREEIETAKGDLQKIQDIKDLEGKGKTEEANKLRAELGLKEGDNLDQKSEELKNTIKDKRSNTRKISKKLMSYIKKP